MQTLTVESIKILGAENEALLSLKAIYENKYMKIYIRK